MKVALNHNDKSLNIIIIFSKYMFKYKCCLNCKQLQNNQLQFVQILYVSMFNVELKTWIWF